MAQTQKQSESLTDFEREYLNKARAKAESAEQAFLAAQNDLNLARANVQGAFVMLAEKYGLKEGDGIDEDGQILRKNSA